MKNLCGKTVSKDQAWQVWQSYDGTWTWYVLKMWQADDDKPYARWFCLVTSPMIGSSGDMGDTYVSDVKSNARKITNRVPGHEGDLGTTPNLNSDRGYRAAVAALAAEFGDDPSEWDI